MICRCSDCKVEFEYDYKISICDECLAKYKKDLSVLTFAHRDECWKEGQNPFKEDCFKGATEEQLIKANEDIELKQILENDCKGENE